MCFHIWTPVIIYVLNIYLTVVYWVTTMFQGPCGHYRRSKVEYQGLPSSFAWIITCTFLVSMQLLPLLESDCPRYISLGGFQWFSSISGYQNHLGSFLNTLMPWELRFWVPELGREPGHFVNSTSASNIQGWDSLEGCFASGLSQHPRTASAIALSTLYWNDVLLFIY